MFVNVLLNVGIEVGVYSQMQTHFQNSSIRYVATEIDKTCFKTFYSWVQGFW